MAGWAWIASPTATAAVATGIGVGIAALRGRGRFGIVLRGNRSNGFLFRLRGNRLSFGFGRWLLRSLRAGSWLGNLGWFRGAEASGAFLRFRFPIGSTKALSGRQVPSAGVSSVTAGLKIARQLKRHHGVPRFGEQIW
jgi:hypothetical protein